MTFYLTPCADEIVGHSSKFSLWRWFDGFRTPFMVIITGGVASTAPGVTHPTTAQIEAADASTSDSQEFAGLAVWSSKNQPHTVTAGEGTILTTAGYTVT